MKTKVLISVFVLVFTVLNVPKVLAFGSGAVPVRRIFSASPVQSFQYAQLIASTVKGVKGVQINNTGNNPIELAFGPSGSEVVQIIVGSKEDTAFLPMSGGYATRLSVISLDGPNEVGELNVNVFYN